MTAPFAALLFAPSGQAGPSMSILLIQVAAIFGIFYLFIIRPQRKQRQEHEKLLASLAKGDQVITSGGIIGEVVHIKDNDVTIRSGEAKLVVLRSNIVTIRNREEAAKPA